MYYAFTCFGADDTLASRENEDGGANDEVGCCGFLGFGWVGGCGPIVVSTSTTRPLESIAL